MRVPLALTLALVVTALTVPLAHAAGWTQPVALTPASPGVDADNAHLVLNANGAQAIVWDDVSTSDFTCLGGEATTRLPGANWAPTVPTGCGAQIQIGPDGTAVVLWQPNTNTVQARTASPGASFGAVLEVDSNSVGHAGLEAAVGPDGRVTVVWTQPGVAGRDILSKTQNSDGSWPAATSPVKTHATDLGTPLALAVGPKGDAAVSWSFTLGGNNGLAVGTRAPTGSTWDETILFGPGAAPGPNTMLLGFDKQDRATLISTILSGGNWDLRAWSRPADTTAWNTSAQSIPNSTAASTDGEPSPSFALDSAGNGLLAFGYPTNPSGTVLYEVRTATRAAGSTTWSNALSRLGPVPCGTATPTPLSVTFDPADTASVAFSCTDGNHIFTRPAGGTSFGPFTGPANAFAPSFVTDPNGYLIATWTADGITYTSVYDAVAPSVDTVDPPANPVAGEPANFTITGSDVWGPVTYSIDFGDGSAPATGRAFAHGRTISLARATVSNAVSHTYATAGNYTATISVTDNAANTATAARALSVAAAPAATAAPSTSNPLPPVPGLPNPVAGLTVNVFPIKQPVRVRLPGAKRFIPLTLPTQIRVGSIIDTRKGRVRVTIDNGHGGLDTADFYAGMFKILQRKSARAFANMVLFGGSFKGCPRAPRVQITSNRRKKADPNKTVRQLWGEGDGQFRTVGRFASATIRGTTWNTADRCASTVVRVTKGKVAVRDFVKKKTKVLKKGQRYVAQASRR